MQNLITDQMMNWTEDLFPICRSLTGRGVRETLKYIKKIHNDLKIKNVKSGEKYFDWEIPNEWEINEAYLEHESGKKFCEFKKNNLHILNYSIPQNNVVDLKELKKKLYSLKKFPNWIPYKTSYYKKDWGFCISEKDKKNLPAGKYKVVIDSSLRKGKLDYAELIIEGKSKKEVFFSTYICHPSMANNELSGPILSTALIKYIKENFKKTKFTYRFVFLPETIGSIMYIAKNQSILKKNIAAGFVLSCVGDNRNFSHIESRLGNTIADQALEAALRDKKKFNKYSYLERGSDERQYCAPGIDLPVCGFSRTKYGEYPEYHTSADNLKLISKKGYEGSLKVMQTIIDSFEGSLLPKSKFFCEPQLSKRNLYPTLGGKFQEDDIKRRMNILSYSDGNHNIFEISKKINEPLNLVNKEVNVLLKYKLII